MTSRAPVIPPLGSPSCLSVVLRLLVVTLIRGNSIQAPSARMDRPVWGSFQTRGLRWCVTTVKMAARSFNHREQQSVG